MELQEVRIMRPTPQTRLVRQTPEPKCSKFLVLRVIAGKSRKKDQIIYNADPHRHILKYFPTPL